MLPKVKNRCKYIIIFGIVIAIIIMGLIIGLVSDNNSEKSSSSGELNKKSDVMESETTINQAATGGSVEPSTENLSANDVNSGQTTHTNFSASTGQLQVSGKNLVDKNGNIVQLKGISTHGINWFPDYINNDCFKQLHEEFGVNVIRLAMYSAEYNGYCTGGDKDYLKGLIDNGVKYATQNDMYVIIDWHILSDNNPNTYADDARSFFDEMSKKYANHTNVLYEICNEPNGGTSWDEIKSYAVSVIEIIKRNDPDAVIIVGTPTWCQEMDKAAASPITGYTNIMYSLHFYAATHTDNLRNVCISAVNSGLPMFVTEFGICDASGNGGIDENQAGKWISLLNENNISYCMWSLCNKAETASAINSSCTKVNAFSVDDLSETGKWFLNMMTGKIDLSKHNETDNSAQENKTESQNQNSSQSDSQSSSENNSQSNILTQNVRVVANAKLVNSWDVNGKTFYQYNITVINNSGKDCSSWTADMEFSENVTIDQSWNGNFSTDGNVIHISSVDYNGSIVSGDKVENIGLIVCGSSDLKILD